MAIAPLIISWRMAWIVLYYDDLYTDKKLPIAQDDYDVGRDTTIDVDDDVGEFNFYLE